MTPRTLFCTLLPLLLGATASCGGDPSERDCMTLSMIGTRAELPANAMILLNVEDCEGVPLAGLDGATDFTITENGAEVAPMVLHQQALPLPVRLRTFAMLLIDMSQNDDEARRATVANAADIFIVGLPVDHWIGIYAFDGRAELQELVPFTTNRDLLAEGLQKISRYVVVDPSTNLNGAIVSALTMLDTTRQTLEEPPYTKGSLTVFTNGRDRANRVDPETTQHLVENSDNLVFTIGTGEEIDDEKLRSLGKSGHERADDWTSIDSAFRAIASELAELDRGLYALSYCTLARGGAVEIEVTAHHQGTKGSAVGVIVADGLVPGCEGLDFVDAGVNDAPVADAGVNEDAPMDATPADAVEYDAATTCPDDMITIDDLGVCIDRFEASKNAAGTVAVSAQGATPWSLISWANASAACVAAGKRLCSRDEWQAGCSGPAPGTFYPYGDTYEAVRCNGLNAGVGAALPTGSSSDCEGGYPGLFDMSGNIAEWTSSCEGSGCWRQGGAFGSGALELRCDTTAYLSPPLLEHATIGFRCCMSLAAP